MKVVTLIALLAQSTAGQTTAGSAGLGHITAATSETRRLTQAIDAELRGLASRGAVWVAYRVRTLPVSFQRCGGSHVMLESAVELTLMARVERGELQRLRVFTPECDVDAGSVPLVWLDGVSADESVRWLARLVHANTNDSQWQSQVVSPALTALAAHPGELASRTMIELAREDARVDIRRRALLSLADRAGQQSVTAITSALQQDPELSVKKQAVVALGRLPADQGVPLLIDVARTNKNRDLQREAMQWLGRSNDPRALKFFEDVLLK